MKLMEEGRLTEDELIRLLIPLNHCIIAAVSEELWHSVEEEIKQLIRKLAQGSVPDRWTYEERLRRLRTASIAREKISTGNFRRFGSRRIFLPPCMGFRT